MRMSPPRGSTISGKIDRKTVRLLGWIIKEIGLLATRILLAGDYAKIWPCSAECFNVSNSGALHTTVRYEPKNVYSVCRCDE